MKKNQKQKGITLIALVISIIVILIIAGISISLVTGNNGILAQTSKAVLKNREKQAEEEVQMAWASVTTEYMSKWTMDSSRKLDQFITKENLNKYINGTGNIEYLVNNNDGTWTVSYKKDDREEPYIITLTKKGDTDGVLEVATEEFNMEKGVNKPKLSEGMIPIKYNASSGKWVICSEEDSDWYNYTSDFKWANVMLSDGTYKQATAVEGTEVEESELGSMFVWIPRYAYSIKEYKTAKNGEGTIQSITDVTFLVSNSNTDKEGNSYAVDYDADSVTEGNPTPKIVHPGFKFGNSNLNGIWVAKFESSMEEENNNTEANNDVTNKTVKVLPNKETWRYIRIGKAFTECLNMKTNSKYGINSTADSHLTKNSEWGAIAYLSASQYGKTPTKNNSGSSYTENNTTKYHSYSGAGDYKTNVSQSTTGNVTGIYDLCGGAWERVAGYYDNGASNLSTYGTATYFSGNKLNANYAKYWDKYEVGEKEKTTGSTLWSAGYSEDNNKAIREIADERYNLHKPIKGDAMFEVMKYQQYSYYGRTQNGSQNWINYPNTTPTSASYGTCVYNGDMALIGFSKRAFVARGGYWLDGGASAGVFASSNHGGIADHPDGFRPVVVVE